MRARVQSRRKEFGEAASHFRVAYRLNPKVETFNANFATASLEAQQWSDAKIAFEQALKSNPTSAESYRGLAKALEGMDSFPHDQLKDAMPKFTLATRLKPQNPQFQYDLCNAAFKLRDIRIAKEACERGIALAGGYAPLRLLSRPHGVAWRRMAWG